MKLEGGFCDFTFDEEYYVQRSDIYINIVSHGRIYSCFNFFQLEATIIKLKLRLLGFQKSGKSNDIRLVREGIKHD